MAEIQEISPSGQLCGCGYSCKTECGASCSGTTQATEVNSTMKRNVGYTITESYIKYHDDTVNKKH